MLLDKVTADGYEEVVDLNNNNDGLDKVQSIPDVTLEEEEEFFDAMEAVSSVEEGNDLGLTVSEEEEFISDLEEREEFFDSKAAAFNVPLSIFHYKDYNSDFFTSWYNMSSEILKEINRACPEKRVLNLALSVLMLPYIAFTALGLVVCSRFKANSKKQEGVGEDKTEKSETGVPKRLAYGVLAAIAIFVNMAVLVALVVPATIALATFYLLNRDLSHSLVTALKISMGWYSNKHQNIEVSFHEKEVPGPNIAWDMEIEFPPQFKRLLRDLCENDKWFDVTRDSEHSIVLKLSTNINLKNGLKPLRNEIKNVLATSIQEFAKTMEELMKLEKKDITYDELKELLNEFRLKVVNSVNSKLTSHLIQDAYRVAFMQAIKFAQGERKKREDFSLEKRLKEALVVQELRSKGKELPTEKEMIIEDLKKAGEEVPDTLDDTELPVFKAEWERLIQEEKIAKRTIIDVYKDRHPQKTKRALDNTKIEIECLKKEGQTRYNGIHEELKAMYDEGKNHLTNDDLKRKLEGLFKFEYDDQEVEQRLVKSVMKKANGELVLLGTLSLIDQFRSLEEEIKGPFSKKGLKEASDKVNDFIAKVYLEITKCKIQNLFKCQGKGIEDSCKLLEKKEPDLVQRISAHLAEIAECLEQPISLRKVIEGNKDLNKYLEDEQNRKGENHPSTKLIQKHLKNNQEILKALKQLELEEKGLLINKKTTNDYREKLESREKIKFAIIEDKLLERLKEKTFNEAEIKKLLEEAELEYCLAEKRMKPQLWIS